MHRFRRTHHGIVDPIRAHDEGRTTHRASQRCHGLRIEFARIASIARASREVEFFGCGQDLQAFAAKLPRIVAASIRDAWPNKNPDGPNRQRYQDQLQNEPPTTGHIDAPCTLFGSSGLSTGRAISPAAAPPHSARDASPPIRQGPVSDRSSNTASAVSERHRPTRRSLPHPCHRVQSPRRPAIALYLHIPNPAGSVPHTRHQTSSSGLLRYHGADSAARLPAFLRPKAQQRRDRTTRCEHSGRLTSLMPADAQ
jgi:hypothetical protein